jgi:hypothetical protein
MKYVFPIAILGQCLLAHADFDQPNTGVERRLQKIFEKYDSDPVPDEKWQSMVGAKAAEAYKVQTGDTLWDLSETLFGDGSYWPKLWSENRSIENPHQILPRKQIRFLAGTIAQAPSIRIEEPDAPKPFYIGEVKENLTAEEMAGGAVIEDADVIGLRPEIPEPAQKPTAILKKIPPSFAMPTSYAFGKKYDSTGFDAGVPKALRSPGSVTLNSFLSSEYPRKLGFVKEIEVQEKTASILQSVFIELGRHVKVGDRLNVIVIKEDVKDSDGNYLGHLIDVDGSIEVTEVVDENNGIYKAIVVDCVMPIMINAAVTDEALPRASFSFSGPRKNIKGKVVGGEYSEKRKILGTASVIYLNIGSDSGVQEGDLLAVQSIRQSSRPETELRDIGRPIGVVKLAKVSKTTSTALILNEIDAIRPGDVTGGEFPQIKKYEIGARAEVLDIEAEQKRQDTEDYKEEFDGEAKSLRKSKEPSLDID